MGMIVLLTVLHGQYHIIIAQAAVRGAFQSTDHFSRSLLQIPPFKLQLKGSACCRSLPFTTNQTYSTLEDEDKVATAAKFNDNIIIKNILVHDNKESDNKYKNTEPEIQLSTSK